MLTRSLTLAAVAAFSSTLAAQSTYTEVGQYSLPFLGANASTAIDGNGILWRLAGSNVYRQAAINSSTFNLVGSVDASGSGLSISPDGSRFAFVGSGNIVRSGLTSALSTSSQLVTTQTTTGGNVSSGGMIWSGSSFYVSSFTPQIPGPGGGIPARVDIVRITGDTSPTVTPVATTGPIVATGSAGGLAERAGRVYWEFDRGFDSARVVALDLAALGSATTPITDAQIIRDTVVRGRALTVDGNNTVISTGQTFNTIGQFFNGFTGASNPGIGSIGGSATFILYNNITSELLVGTNRAGEVALRFTIPTPSAVAALGLMGLAAARRRR
jgi:hypothetical protein